MEIHTQAHIDRTQKSLAMLAIMRRIEEKRKKKPRRRVTTDSSVVPARRDEALPALLS